MTRRLPALALLALACSHGARADDEPPGRRPGAQQVRENRLARERSPYLRQHARNPVDWYPWGEEAFARARAEDRPIFLSVGYAACHWCHVMEHESFEDEATARLLNETFVCVKVDREERPDVDALYMKAVQATSGRGGWPMTVLLTPGREPFWAGTYLPRDAVVRLAQAVRAEWGSSRARVEQAAARIVQAVRAMSETGGLPPYAGDDRGLLDVVRRALAAAFDPGNGGYGARPKFPPHGELLLLLDRRGAVGGAAGLDQVRRTLEKMEEGGVHDHVGGGFHRYSTDERWFVPHFEKMLYDNALLAQAYAGFFEVSGEARFARVAGGILDCLRRDFARPGGGYASSLDADTEGEEGLTYTWTPAELGAALGPEDAAFAASVFDVREEGNYAEEATGRSTGRNILHLARPLAAWAAERHQEVGDVAQRLGGVRQRLLEARLRRAQPGLDEKVITAWNGLLLSAFARVGTVLSDERALADGRALATWLLAACRAEDGTLLRFPRDSGTPIPGFCEDHVHLAQGLLDLAAATGETRWLEAARGIADELLAHFEDPEGGGFFTTSDTRHEPLLARMKEAMDTPIPSDNGVAARLLLQLAERTGASRYREAADRTLLAWRPLLGRPGAATFATALFRALADRLALDEAHGAADVPGDATAADDLLRADAFLEREQARLGSSVRLALRLRVAPGWHVNPPEGDALGAAPTALALAPGSPVTLPRIAWPVPARRVLAPGEAPAAILEGEVWIRAEIRVPADAPAGPRRVELRLTAQPCSGATCDAERTLELALPLRFHATEDGPARHAAIFVR